MKPVFILSLLFIIILCSWEIPPLVQPPLPISTELIVTMDSDNQKLTAHRISLSSAVNIDAINDKKIPWIFILSIGAVSLMWLIIRLFPSSFLSTSMKAKSQAEALKEATQRLSLILKCSSEVLQQEADHFHVLDHALKVYFKEKNQINISNLTTQEIINQGKKWQSIDKNTYANIISILTLIDKILYARYRPSLEECSQIINEAKQLMEPALLDKTSVDQKIQ